MSAASLLCVIGALFVSLMVAAFEVRRLRKELFEMRYGWIAEAKARRERLRFAFSEMAKNDKRQSVREIAEVQRDALNHAEWG